MADLRVKFGTKNTEKADFLHSSGYAKAQSGNNVGSAADAASFATRQAVEVQRQYVKKYRNARLLQGLRAYDRAKTYVPRVEKPANVTPGRGSLTSKESPQNKVDKPRRSCYNRDIGRPYGGISSDG